MNTCQAPNAVNVCIKIVTDNKLRESLQLVSMVHLSASGKRRNLLLKYLGLHESLLSCSLTKAFLINGCYNHNDQQYPIHLSIHTFCPQISETI